ncbi:MAG: 8-oxo-dGTP pyrophosphatase MutT (NUDIX family) [Paracoccaceae bacterium]|jgi:8-oxo-dGTP pyrophosphatase MutT (NUDIX family)
MPDTITHAGGAIFRQRGTTIEYLLVAATGNTGDWVLPKGHIDAGEDPAIAALREVAEEAGIAARVLGPVPGRLRFPAVHDGKAEVVEAIFYLMEYTGEADSQSENRSLRWLSLDDALATLTFAESREVLSRAEELRLLSDQAR